MIEDKIKRINELARKQKAEGLTDEEKAEQAELRREYIESYKRSLIAQLENTYVVDDNGNKQKLTERVKTKEEKKYMNQYYGKNICFFEKNPDSKFNKSLMVAIKTKSGRKTINGNEYKEFINDEVAFEETLNDQTLKEHLKKDFFINN